MNTFLMYFVCLMIAYPGVKLFLGRLAFSMHQRGLLGALSLHRGRVLGTCLCVVLIIIAQSAPFPANLLFMVVISVILRVGLSMRLTSKLALHANPISDRRRNSL